MDSLILAWLVLLVGLSLGNCFRFHHYLHAVNTLAVILVMINLPSSPTFLFPTTHFMLLLPFFMDVRHRFSPSFLPFYVTRVGFLKTTRWHQAREAYSSSFTAVCRLLLPFRLSLMSLVRTPKCWIKIIFPTGFL